MTDKDNSSKVNIKTNKEKKPYAIIKEFIGNRYDEELKTIGQNYLKDIFSTIKIEYKDLQDWLDGTYLENIIFNDYNRLISYIDEAIKEKLINDSSNSISLPTAINLNIIISNIPKTNDLRRLRTAKYINKTVSTKGVIKNIRMNSPKAIKITYNCETCGNQFEIYTKDRGKKLRCNCCGEEDTNKIDIIHDKTVYEDTQRMYVEELLENRKGNLTPGFNCYLDGGLFNPDKPFNPGETININGVMSIECSEPMPMDYLLLLNDITPDEDTFKEINITKEDEKQLKEIISKHGERELLKKLSESILPDIYGHDDLKQGIAVQMAAGDLDLRPDVFHNINIFVIGDPGIAKSEILKRITRLSPRAKYMNAVTTTTPGLIGSVKQEKASNNWTLESGAINEANLGVLCLDELDKNPEIAKSLNEPMAQHTISFDKAGVNTIIPVNTQVLAVANPKKSVFDKFNDTLEQTKVIDESTYSRFGLIYAIPNITTEDEDKEIAYSIMDKGRNEQYLSDEFITKYIAYIKKTFKPELSRMAKDKIANFYANLNKKAKANDYGKPITGREVETITNISIAIARIGFNQNVTPEHVDLAIEIYENSIKTLGLTLEEAGAVSNVKSNKELELDGIAEKLIHNGILEYGADMNLTDKAQLFSEVQLQTGFNKEQFNKKFKEIKKQY